MYEMMILAIWFIGFGEFEFSRTFWHFGNLNFPHFLTFWKFDFLSGKSREEESAGKFKFPESCSEYYPFIQYLYFRNWKLYFVAHWFFVVPKIETNLFVEQVTGLYWPLDYHLFSQPCIFKRNSARGALTFWIV